MVKGGRGPSFLLACWCTRSWVGIISAQPHAIVKQIRFPKGKVLFLSLFSLSKNCMHGVTLGFADIFSTSPQLRLLHLHPTTKLQKINETPRNRK